MAYYQRIVSVLAKLPARGICHGCIFEDDTGFEGEGRNDGDFLVRNQLSVRIFRLTFGTLYGI
jgi:hypothetical protein